MVVGWIKSRWICDYCATEKGGECLEAAITGKIGTCPYCTEKNRVLTPWFAYQWPHDLKLERCAMANRDGLDLDLDFEIILDQEII